MEIVAVVVSAVAGLGGVLLGHHLATSAGDRQRRDDLANKALEEFLSRAMRFLVMARLGEQSVEQMRAVLDGVLVELRVWQALLDRRWGAKRVEPRAVVAQAKKLAGQLPGADRTLLGSPSWANEVDELQRVIDAFVEVV